MARPMWFPAAVALCVLWVAGCSAVEEENPWADTIREWESRASSDFEREVLSDGEITEAEYREAVDRMITCARDQGVEVSVTESGYVYESDMASSEHTSQIVDECNIGTISIIEGLWYAMQANPENIPVEQLIVECLVENGVVPPDYDPAELGNDYVTGTIAGRSVEDPVVQECLYPSSQ